MPNLTMSIIGLFGLAIYFCKDCINGRSIAKRIYESDYGYDWAMEAGQRMKKFILTGDHKQLINYRAQEKESNLAVPIPEHYLPLLYTLALKHENEEVTLFNEEAVGGSLTMTSVKISGD